MFVAACLLSRFFVRSTPADCLCLPTMSFFREGHPKRQSLPALCQPKTTGDTRGPAEEAKGRSLASLMEGDRVKISDFMGRGFASLFVGWIGLQSALQVCVPRSCFQIATTLRPSPPPPVVFGLPRHGVPLPPLLVSDGHGTASPPPPPSVFSDCHDDPSTHPLRVTVVTSPTGSSPLVLRPSLG